MQNKTSFLFVALVPWLLFICSRVKAQVVINEVLYNQELSLNNTLIDHDWVEIYNYTSAPVDLAGWALADQPGTVLTVLPAIDLPAGAYLVIHFRQGNNDFNFNGGGHYYTGDNHLVTNFLPEDMGRIALVESVSVTPATLVDFLAWSGTTQDYLPSALDDLAEQAGIWTSGDYFDGLDRNALAFQKRKTVSKGTTIGRDQYAHDENLPADWDNTGGSDAYYMTPGRINFTTIKLVVNPPAPQPAAPVEWTFMVYLSADNNLEGAAFLDLNEMELAGIAAGDNINIVVMVDFSPAYMPVQVSYDNGVNWLPTHATFRGGLRNDNDRHQVYLYPPPGETGFVGEKNLGDPATLTEFINWGMSTYPASRYALVLWDHGSGWKANTFDDAQNDELHIGELKGALAAAQQPLDLIGFDECYMAMIEVAYQVADYGEVMVASEEYEEWWGWPYDLILANLKLNPGMSAEALGSAIVADYDLWYQASPDRTLSAVALGDPLKELAQKVSQFGYELKTGVEDYQEHYIPGDNVQLLIKSALLGTEKFGDVNFIDLHDFAHQIELSSVPQPYKSQAVPIQDDLMEGQEVVIAEEHGPTHAAAGGLSIYYPVFQTKDDFGQPYDMASYALATARSAADWVKYSSDPDDCTPADWVNHPRPPAPGFDFTTDTEWDEFLHRYYEPVADAGKDTIIYVGGTVTLKGSGSSDADGEVRRWYWDINPAIDTDDGNYDRDCPDETDDDSDLEGEIRVLTFDEPGTYPIVLTVWDDHNAMDGDNHPEHFETDQDIVQITVLPLFTLAEVIWTDVTCFAGNDGEATVAPVGGEEPYTYVWSDGQTTPTAVGLSAGAYTVTVSDAGGAALTTEVVISEPLPLEITVETTSPQCPDEATGSLFVIVEGGTPPYQTVWSTGETTPVIDNLTTGLYDLTITDDNGCETSFDFELTAEDVTAPVIVAAQNVVFTLGPEGTVVVDPGLLDAGTTDNCGEVTLSVEPADFDCTLTGENMVTLFAEDPAGNVSTTEVNILIVDNQAPVITTDEVTLILGPDGSAGLTPDLIGTADNCSISSMTVDQGTFSCDDVGENLVMVTVTDQAGNMTMNEVAVWVEDQSPPVVVAQDVTLTLNEDGMAFLTTELVDAGSYDACGIDNLMLSQSVFACDVVPPAGERNEQSVLFTVTDVNGNSAVTDILVTLVDELPPAMTCPEDMVVDFCGPVDYELPVVTDNCNVETFLQTDGLGAGAVFPMGATMESFTAIDSYGNEASCSFTVTVLNLMEAGVETSTVNCAGGDDGSAVIEVTGGTSPFTYTWPGGQTGAEVTDLAAGDYDVTVTDFYGCQTMISFTIVEPPALLADVIEVINETNGQGNGAVVLSVTGGTGPYTLEGETFEEEVTISSLAEGFYTFVISDANGCQITAEAFVENLVGTSAVKQLKRFAVYPNPTTGLLKVEVELHQVELLQLSFYNAQGQSVWSSSTEQVNEKVFQVDLTGQASGIYLIRLRAGEKVLTHPVLVSRR